MDIANVVILAIGLSIAIGTIFGFSLAKVLEHDKLSKRDD